MARDRYLQALRCQGPSVIPHQLSLSHSDFISDAAGVDYFVEPMTASIRFHERFDVDNGGPTHTSDAPLERPAAAQTRDDGGTQTDEAFHTVWHTKPPFTEPEDVWGFDPDPWGENAEKAMFPGYAMADFRWAFEPDTWAEKRRQDQENWAKLEALWPGKFTDGRGVYCTTFMWGICLFGWDLFLTALGLDPDKTGQALRRISDVTVRIFQYYATCDEIEFIGTHDDLCMTAGPVTTPDWYRRHIWPQYEELFAPFTAAGKPVILTSDGDITKLADDLASIVDGFLFESSTPPEPMFDRFGQTKCLIGGIDVRPLTFGAPDDVEAEVTRAVELARHCPGYVISCSDTIPGNVPIQNVYRYFDTVEKLRHR
jgi:uroporphyrinogen decarboxylase-like protein